MDIYEESVELHEKKKGKLEVKSKVSLKDKKDLSLAYTPGVAGVSKKIGENKKLVWKYTIKQNSVAIVTDGSAILGLGNLGPEAALPVMEGKAILFKELADVDAYPICLKTRNIDEIVNIVKRIKPGFGGINLEDISAPRCFEVEDRLQEIGIPVFHDDQHGTAIVLLAALINALKVVNKRPEDVKVVINGAGAAGNSISHLLLCIGYDKKICLSVKEIILCDSQGIIFEGRRGMDKYKEAISKYTNKEKLMGSLEVAMKGADVFIGVSKGNLVTKEMVKSMNKDAIVLAMANPIPEIMPEDAKAAGAVVVGTGRSDFPNQINNVLGFPGIFRGALDANAFVINKEMKVAAAYALASIVKNPTKDKILPSPLDKNVVKVVASAVKDAALVTGVSNLEN
ncbi:NADP-dependent malic enzyme [Nanoarchaeota archaeon]